MQVEKCAKEMEGKILLLHNKKFIACISFIGAYYMAYLFFLTHLVIQSGGFH